MLRLIKITFYLGVLALLGAGAAAAWVYTDVQRFLNEPVGLTESYRIAIPQGSSVRGIAKQLQKEGLIHSNKDVEYFVRWLQYTKQTARLKAGEFDVPQDVTGQGLIDTLIDGKLVQYRLTIVPGWHYWNLFAAVDASPDLVHKTKGLDAKTRMQMLGYPDVHPEGRFAADTYLFPKGTTDIEFLQRAYQAQEAQLAAAWAAKEAKLPYKTPEEALIMASIVEKETGRASERPDIAGVFVNRLNIDMRLQTDPTVIYGLGESFNGNITRRNLRTDTPYNSYTRKGLPPTPIAVPSPAALHAALHPAKHNYLYFVARGDGTTHFSPNLREHERAVRRYQLGR